jgi:prepilin-type processing-associated H-X9-DG protein
MGRRTFQVVASLIAALLSLVIITGFVFKARVAALNIECQDNLKGLGFGLNAYKDTKGRWPYATVPNDRLTPEKRLSWYVESWSLFDQSRLIIDKDEAWDSPRNAEPLVHYMDAGEVPVGYWKEFACPAAPNADTSSRLSLTNYVGVAGLGGTYAASLPITDPWAGFFGFERRCTESDITNGLSNTIAVAETLRDNGPWTAGGTPTVRGLEQHGLPYLGEDGQFNSAHYIRTALGFAKHSYTNILFADGSVRSFTDSMDSATFEAMASIHGRSNN